MRRIDSGGLERILESAVFGLDEGMPPPPDIDALSPAEVKSLAVKLLEKTAELERLVAALRDEIARLKGGPGRPNVKANVKPSGMEKASEAKPSAPFWRAARARRPAREGDRS